MGRLEDDRPDGVPFIVYESATARLERTIRRLWILCIIIFLAFVASNGAWIWYESQFTDSMITVEQDNADGYNNFIGNDGDIINGEAKDND